MTTLGSCGVALTFNEDTQSTNCVVIGFCSHQLDLFKKELFRFRHHCSDPRLAAVLWMGILAEVRVVRSGHRRIELENIQLRTGMHLTIEETLLHKVSLDIDSLTHKITVLWHNLAWDEFALKTLLQAHTRLTEVFPMDLNRERPRNDLNTRIQNIRDLLHGLQSRTASSLQHANIQLQTVSMKAKWAQNKLMLYRYTTTSIKGIAGSTLTTPQLHGNWRS